MASDQRWVSIRVPAGASQKRIQFAERAGVIRLFRAVVPAGTPAELTGVIPSLAHVDISTPVARSDPSGSCARHGAADVCTQSEEACLMPAATWQFRLRKLAGPAGRIRIEFVVG